MEALWTGKEGGPGKKVLASGVKEKRGRKVPWGTSRVCSPGLSAALLRRFNKGDRELG